MFPEWTWIFGLCIGAAIGSFLNVVIYRMPRSIPLGKPVHSFCPKCKNQLRTIDLIPLLSWLFLRGRCRQCGAKVASRYFWVELLTGAIFSGLWYQFLILGEDPARALAYAAAASALVAIIFIDWELYIIPDQINAFLAIVGLAYNGWLYYVHSPAATTWNMPSSIAGWLTGTGIIWGIAFLGRVAFRKDAMGHGDIKMARGIGAVLFPAVAALSFGLAVILGAVLGIIQIYARKTPPVLADRVRDVPAGTEEATAVAADVEAVSEPEEEEDLPPESIGSLLKCGVGYFLGIDIIGLFIPRLYVAWFNESPFEPVEEWEDYEVENTMIPFGPYLALGAIVASVFSSQLLHGVDAYLNYMSGDRQNREQLTRSVGLVIGDGWSVCR